MVVSVTARALATALASIVVMLCAPVLPISAIAGPAAEAAAPASEPAGHDADFEAHAMVVPPQDSASISKALAKWGGDQRPVTRELPDGHLPEQDRLPGIGGTWGRGALPESSAAPERAERAALPFGRAPPLAA